MEQNGTVMRRNSYEWRSGGKAKWLDEKRRKSSEMTSTAEQGVAWSSNGIEKRGGDLTCKGIVVTRYEPKSRRTAEQGCAEAKLCDATLCYDRERRGVDVQWRRAEQTRIVKEINDGK